MSGRGGTTGRAAGWPAKPGRAGVLSGKVGGAGAAGVEAAAAAGAGVGGAAARATGTPGAAGSGWRGPERICPGRGAGGTGLAGIGVVRRGGCMGALPPAARGGRIGAGFGRSDSSTPAVEAAPSLGTPPGASAAANGAGLARTAGCSAAGAGAGTGCSCWGASATATAGARSDGAPGSGPPWTRRRISSATASSMELE